MEPKKVSRDSSRLKKRARNTIMLKKEIIAKFESGVKIAEIARMYGKAPSTISSIVAKKEAIKQANVAKGVDMLTKRRSQAMEDVEKLLLIWINSKRLDGDSISEAMICQKARLLYADLIQKLPERSDSVLSDFKASRGWFEKFKRRTGIHSVSRHGGAARSDKSGAEDFVSEFTDYLEAEGFIPQQVFNCETGLFWKKMPKRTFVTQEEKTLPGHKPLKDRATFLFCENASDDDCEVKPLLVCHSETPRVFSRDNVDDHREDLATEELQDLHQEMQQMADEEATIKEEEELQDLHQEMQQTADEEAALDEETRENVTSSEIKDILSMWSKVQGFVENHHPDKAVAYRVCNLFNDNALPHFRQILKRRQKQTFMDRLIVRHGSTDSEAGPSAERPNFPCKEEYVKCSITC